MSSDHVTLTAARRTEFGSAITRRLRKTGQVPGVLYTEGGETVSFHISHHELFMAIQGSAAKTAVFEVSVGDDGSVPALLKDWQLNPVRNEIMHVDFQQVDLKVAVQAAVPIVLVGMAEGVREGGVLDQSLHEVMVEALPDAIPEGIEIDVSDLDVGGVRLFSELVAPEGVTLLGEAETVVASVTVPSAVEAPESDGEEGAEPELVGGSDDDQDDAE